MALCSESARLPPMLSGFYPGPFYKSVEFVVGSHPCLKGFCPGSPVFFSPQKPTFPNSSSSWTEAPTWKPAEADVASSLNKVIYLFFFF